MQDRAAFHLDEKSAESTMGVRQHSRPPVVSRGKSHLHIAELDRLPYIEFMHAVEAEPLHETSDIARHDDRLLAGYASQRLAVEVVEMRMRDEHGVDFRQRMQFEAGLTETFHDLEPACPVRIDEQIHTRSLEQE